jgi:hypothetical protein
MDVGVRSSNDIYDPIGQGVDNTVPPTKSSTKGGHPTYHQLSEAYIVEVQSTASYDINP